MYQKTLEVVQHKLQARLESEIKTRRKLEAQLEREIETRQKIEAKAEQLAWFLEELQHAMEISTGMRNYYMQWLDDAHARLESKEKLLQAVYGRLEAELKLQQQFKARAEFETQCRCELQDKLAQLQAQLSDPEDDA